MERPLQGVITPPQSCRMHYCSQGLQHRIGHRHRCLRRHCTQSYHTLIQIALTHHRVHNLGRAHQSSRRHHYLYCRYNRCHGPHPHYLRIHHQRSPAADSNTRGHLHLCVHPVVVDAIIAFRHKWEGRRVLEIYRLSGVWVILTIWVETIDVVIAIVVITIDTLGNPVWRFESAEAPSSAQ